MEMEEKKHQRQKKCLIEKEQKKSHWWKKNCHRICALNLIRRNILTKNKDGQYGEKKGLPASSENKDAEERERERETFGTAITTAHWKQLKPMNIDERLVCTLFPIRPCVFTHLLCLSDHQRWGAATRPPGFIPASAAGVGDPRAHPQGHLS